jgi:hypothetical protein
MSVILNSQFATAEDTAAALGVSDARLNRLIRVAGLKVNTRRGLATVGHKAGANGKFRSPVARASRRKQTRGKTTKATPLSFHL